ncbi:pilus assembly protein PilM [bacterium]|nr:pilus assembly protein PilM [bacterium]
MSLFSGKLRVGVDLGSTTIKVVGVHQIRHSYELQFYDVVDLVQEYCPNATEEIQDDLYVEQLQKIAATHRMKDATLSVTLPADSAVIHLIHLDASQSDEEAAETIQSELGEVGLEKLDKMQIVVQPIEAGPAESGQQALLACAVPKETMRRYLAILRETGLKPSVLDLDALGVYNAFHFFSNKKISFPLTVVQIGSHYTICSILLPGKTPFFKVIKLGGNDLVTSIMDEFNFSYYKAEVMKNRFLDSSRTTTISYRKTKLYELLFNFSEQISSEIKKCVRHFQTFEGVVENGQVYVTGGSAKLHVLLELIADHLRMNIHVWNPLDHFIKTSPDQDDEQRRRKGVHLTSALGAVLRGD